jgi:hypothetical protein
MKVQSGFNFGMSNNKLTPQVSNNNLGGDSSPLSTSLPPIGNNRGSIPGSRQKIMSNTGEGFNKGGASPMGTRKNTLMDISQGDDDLSRAGDFSHEDNGSPPFLPITPPIKSTIGNFQQHN